MSTHASDAAPIVSFRVAAVLFLPVKDSRFIISGGVRGFPLLPWDYKGDACRYISYTLSGGGASSWPPLRHTKTYKNIHRFEIFRLKPGFLLLSGNSESSTAQWFPGFAAPARTVENGLVCRQRFGLVCRQRFGLMSSKIRAHVVKDSGSLLLRVAVFSGWYVGKDSCICRQRFAFVERARGLSLSALFLHLLCLLLAAKGAAMAAASLPRL